MDRIWAPWRGEYVKTIPYLAGCFLCDAVAGTETRVFQKRFGASPAPVGLLIAPDGGRAFVSAAHADVVTVIDLEKLRVDDAWPAGHEPDGLAGRFGTKAADVRKPAPRRVTPRRPD